MTTIEIVISDALAETVADKVAARLGTAQAATGPLKLDEAADRLQLSRSTVKRLVAQGRLRRIPDLDRTLLITRESVERFERGEA